MMFLKGPETTCGSCHVGCICLDWANVDPTISKQMLIIPCWIELLWGVLANATWRLDLVCVQTATDGLACHQRYLQDDPKVSIYIYIDTYIWNDVFFPHVKRWFYKVPHPLVISWFKVSRCHKSWWSYVKPQLCYPGRYLVPHHFQVFIACFLNTSGLSWVVQLRLIKGGDTIDWSQHWSTSLQSDIWTLLYKLH